MKKSRALLLVLATLPSLLSAQNLYDRSFVNQLAINPAYASIANPNVKDWTASILSFQTDIASNTGSMSFWDIVRVNGPYIRDRILTTSRISTGQGNIALFGPGISARISPRLTVSATTAIRLYSNYWGLDGRLISEIGEYVKVQQEYPYQMVNRKMRLDLAAFSEFAPGLSYDLVKNRDYSVSLGGSLKLLMSNSHTSIALSDFSGTVNRYNSYLTALNNASGIVSTQTSGQLFESFGAGELVTAQKLSLGGNLGFVFKHNGNDAQSHDFTFAMSLIDIGSLRYEADSAYTKQYDIDINEGEGLYFNNNFKNSNFSKTTLVFDRYPGLFKRTSTRQQTYKVRLPTALVVQMYARYNRQLGVRLNGRLGLSKQQQDHLYSPSGLMLEPVYDHKKIQVSLPISYYRYMGFGMGVAFKAGNITFGSQTLLSSMVTKSRHLDFSVALELKKR